MFKTKPLRLCMMQWKATKSFKKFNLYLLSSKKRMPRRTNKNREQIWENFLLFYFFLEFFLSSRKREKNHQKFFAVFKQRFSRPEFYSFLIPLALFLLVLNYSKTKNVSNRCFATLRKIWFFWCSLFPFTQMQVKSDILEKYDWTISTGKNYFVANARQ